MPVIKSKHSVTPVEALVKLLVHELQQPQGSGQPLILQNAIGESDAFNVFVIWERWAGIPSQERSASIREALRQFDPNTATKIPIAEGLTFDEAITLGYLPYKIEALIKPGEDAPVEQIKKAFEEEGPIETAQGRQLRFATLEAAQQAYIRLSEKVPGPYWVFGQEIPVEA